MQQSNKSLLEPDYCDDAESLDPDDTIVSSFKDIRQKTLISLYPSGSVNSLIVDKSPKGSVDEGIQPLVDLINHHPSFATLSSCSGRITLFDPNSKSLATSSTDSTASSGPINNNTLDHDESEKAQRFPDDNNIGGKGNGTWLLSIHRKITYSELEQALNQHKASLALNMTHETSDTSITPHQALMFKHEPLLLHVAASTIRRARQLLTIGEIVHQSLLLIPF